MRSFFFIVVPYVAWTLAILVGLYRYFTNRFSYSSLSSELLEKRQLLWGSVPFHYGLILILLAHIWRGSVPEPRRRCWVNRFVWWCSSRSGCRWDSSLLLGWAR